ncbi:unnamed protein product [Diamesa tonsa]
MLSTKIASQHTGIYRTKDDINNLQIRITLKKLYSIIKIPKFDIISNAGTNEQQTSNDFEEIVNLNWQQKLFNKFELNYYGLKENCKTELEKKYHQLIKKKTSDEDEEPQESRLIFTYTSDDKYIPDEHLGIITKLKQSVESEEKMKEEVEVKKKSGSLFIDEKLESVSSRYMTGDDYENMYILADLEPTTLLFIIQYRKFDGLFLVYPDFNEIEKPYYLEIDQNSKQMYYYSCENMSKIQDDNRQERLEQQKLQDIQEETCELMKKLSIFNNNRDSDFQNPKYCRILLLLEIVNAKDFEYDNLHVQFKIRIPKYVKVLDGELEGSTHSSMKQNDQWNFGYCHSVTLDIEDEFMISQSESNSISLNFEVISIEKLWERERREGITSVKLSLDKPQLCHNMELQCYRDLQSGSWWKDSLERFFLGGIHKTRLQEEHQEGFTNFYGNQTISTGQLNIKIQLVKQFCPSLRNNLQTPSIDEVIQSYRRAKARLDL